MRGFASRQPDSHSFLMRKSLIRSIGFSALIVLGTMLTAPVYAQKVNFEKQVWPILEAKCVSCHKAPYEENGRTRKPKAGLRLDGAWAITMGSEHGAVMKAGDSENSELYIRTTLPEDDDEFMPPTGKADPLTKDEKQILAKWIDQGAEFGGWVGSLEGKPKQVSNAGGKIPVSEIQEIYKKLGADLKPLKEKAWESVTASGGRVMPLADSSPLLSVDYRLTAEDATNEKIKPIGSIAKQIAHLDLSKTQVTDEMIVEIGKMERLVRLDLHRTEISDAKLGQLKKLKHLRYLNLYGTEVSDAGLKQLHTLKNLRAVYLWDSKATKQGAAALAKALPDAKVNIQ